MKRDKKVHPAYSTKNMRQYAAKEMADKLSYLVISCKESAQSTHPEEAEKYLAVLADGLKALELVFESNGMKVY